MSATAVTPARVVRSEWLKLTTLRSTLFAVACAVGLMLGIGLLASWMTVHDWATMTAADRADEALGDRVLLGHHFAELAIGVVGVIAVTGEYATGMIRATLAAAPWRLSVLWAKLGVLTALTLVLMTPTAFASFFAGNAILAKHWHFALSDPGRLRGVLMTAVTLTVVCLLGAAGGFILRNTAATISILFGVLMVLPIVGEFSPRVAEYLPTGAMTSLVSPQIGDDMLAPWPAFAVLCAYLVVTIAGAAVTLARRDA